MRLPVRERPGEGWTARSLWGVGCLGRFAERSWGVAVLGEMVDFIGEEIRRAVVGSGEQGKLAWVEAFIFLVFLKVAAALIGVVEQPGDKRGVGDPAHMTVLVFGGEAFDGAHQDGDV